MPATDLNTPDATGRVCRKCDTWKAREEFSPGAFDRSRDYCRDCNAARNRDYRARNRDLVRTRSREASRERYQARKAAVLTGEDTATGRICPGCDQWQPRDSYSMSEWISLSVCKGCGSQRRQAQYRSVQATASPPVPGEGRTCTACGEWKARDNYPPSRWPVACAPCSTCDAAQRRARRARRAT